MQVQGRGEASVISSRDPSVNVGTVPVLGRSVLDVCLYSF